jgi:hypothetical protein
LASVLANGWNHIKAQKSAFDGTADWSAITTIRSYISGAPDAEVIYYLDAIRMTRKDPISAVPNPFQIENDGVMERVFEVSSGTPFLGYDGTTLCIKPLETLILLSVMTFTNIYFNITGTTGNKELPSLWLYKDDNNYIRFKPYNRIFREAESVNVPGFGPLDAYANRDSLPYKEFYALEDTHTILRATFRYPDFCQGWAILVFLGLTNDQLQLNDCDQLSFRDFLNMFLPPDDSPTVRSGFERLLRERMNLDEAQISTTMVQFDYLDFFGDQCFKRAQGSPAELLLEILERKWQLAPGDRDLIVMHHRLDYELHGNTYSETSTLLLEGENENYTAMAKTVGLPLAIAVRLYLEGKLNLTGVLIPTNKALYEPIMEELKAYGVQFK